jgi:hypothetical protein
MEALAVAAQVENRGIDGLFIEVFTRAGAWRVAARLAESAVTLLPDDAWNRTRKLAADQIRVATAFEAAVSSGLTGRVSALATEWIALDEAIKKDRRENAERRDPLWGLHR